MSSNRELANMARSAGLEPLGFTQRNGRLYVEVLAPNGATDSFFVLTRKKDSRAEMECLSEMKRFARINPAPEAKPEPGKAAEAPAAHEAAISVKPRKRITVKAAEQTNHTTTVTAPATGSQATQDLTTAEIFRLCQWTKQQGLAQFPSLEALALAASSHIGHTVSEQSMREVMAATDTDEPDHWTPLPDPHVIVARELAAFMESLGAKPSPTFARWIGTLSGAAA